MRPLYLSKPVRQAMPEAIRPGGFVLTNRLAEEVEIHGKTVVDAGCGSGASLRFLQEKGAGDLIGIDPELSGFTVESTNITFLCGRMEALPLASGIADLLVAECAWNLSARKRSLQEFHRVLKRGGQLFLSDIFSRANPQEMGNNWPVACCFSAAESLPAVQQMVEEAGFYVRVVEEHTELLKKTAAEFIFRYGSLEAFWQQVTGSGKAARQACQASRLSMPGLFLLLAEKR